MIYLIVSLVIVGSIIVTPSFLTKSKFTFVSETEVLSTPEWEQHSLTTLWDEPHAEKKPNRYKQNNNQSKLTTEDGITPIWDLIIPLPLFFIIISLFLFPR